MDFPPASARRDLAASRWLHPLLAAVVSLPVLAFAYGTRQDKVVFVLYREPKVAAIQILGMALLVALFWLRREDFQIKALLAALLRPPWCWLALFLAYGLGTAAWAAVPENAFYELGQYVLLLLVVLSLDIWADRDPAVPRTVALGLVLGMGAATAVGFAQAAFPMPFLSPIDSGSGVSNSSVLGYKNPMALALAGQIFLLADQVRAHGWSRSGRLLAVLLAAELIDLATLQSRTSMVALCGGVGLLVLLLVRRMARHGGTRGTLGAGLAVFFALALFLLALVGNPVTRSRAATMLPYLEHPTRYLESDRGIYLLNSVQMVRHHPWGIGFGDWQSQYPVYRLHGRDQWFTPSVQVRMAHSDPVQTFGETGWPGITLWACFWCSLLAPPLRKAWTTGNASPMLLASQVAAFGLATLTDAVTEHPYLKLELALVAFLALRASGSSAPPLRDGGRGGRRRPWEAWVVTALAVAVIPYAICSSHKAWLGAKATAAYRAAMEPLERRGWEAALAPEERELLREAVRAGEKMASMPGYHKGLCDDYRILADSERRLGDPSRALAYTRAALHLHPYSPNALWLMAELLHDRPSEALAWWRAAEHVMNEATNGFTLPYPDASR